MNVRSRLAKLEADRAGPAMPMEPHVFTAAGKPLDHLSTSYGVDLFRDPAETEDVFHARALRWLRDNWEAGRFPLAWQEPYF